MTLPLLAAPTPVDAATNIWTKTGATDGSVLALAIDPVHTGVIYAGTFNTVFKSNDGGAEWQMSGRGLPIPLNLQITALAVDPTTPATIYAGTGGFGVLKSVDAGSSWRPASIDLREGTVRGLQIAPSLPTTLYAEVTPSGLVRSTDGGASWQSLNRSIGTLPLAVDPTTSTTLYAGATKSTDGGVSWQPIDAGLPRAPLTTLAIDPAAPATLYLGTRSAGLFKSTDGGASWHARNAGLPDPNVTVLVIDPTAPSIIYAGTVGGGVFKSIDGAATWFTLASPADGEVTAVVIDPARPALIYAAIAGEVFSLQQDGTQPSITPAPTPPLSFDPRCYLQLDPAQGPAGTVIRFSGRCEEIHSGARADLYFGTKWLGEVVGETGGIVVDGTELQVPADARPGPLILQLIRGGRVAAASFDVQPLDLQPTPTCSPTPPPTAPPAGAAVWSFAGPDGGIIHALAADPTTPDTIYVGTEEGGVFKSTDSGVSWGTANRGLPPRPDVRTVVINPTDAATLYAGTRGAGVFRSTDAGVQWNAMSSGLNSVGVNALAIDPAAPSTLYAATKDRGIFKSVDGCTEWSAINTGLASVEINCLAFDPSASMTMYAGTQGAGVFKTTDGGGHWQAGEASTPRYVNGLAIDPLIPSTLYAATVDGVSKSTDGGVNWFTADAGISYSNGGTPVSVLSLVIDPTNSLLLWAGSYTAGVFISTDGGATWILASPDSPGTTYAFALGRAAPQALYAGGFGLSKSTDRGTNWNTTGLPLVASVNALDIDAAHPSTLYIATVGEGVLKSTDGAVTWSRASSGLTTPYINDTKLDAAAPSILYASTDEGLFESTDAGSSWRATTLSGETRVLAIAATQPPTVLAASFDSSIGNDVFRSTDTGATWQPSGLRLGIVGLVTDPHDPRTIYAGRAHTYGMKNGGIFKSTDAGAHWAATGLLTFDGVHPLAVDPESSAVVYAAYGGGLLKSTDGGDSWRAMNNGLPDGGAGQLIFDPLDPHRMYVSAGDVFTSTDAGGNWTILGSPFAQSVSALALDPVAGTTLYAGTSSGVFVLQRTDLDPTRTARATPTPTSTPDPRCPADQIAVVPSTAPPGARVMLSGQCYFLHSGRHADVYFDTTFVGAVTGDTIGNYTLEFTVPGDALPGSHQVRVTGAQSTTLGVQRDDNIPTPTPPIGVGECPSDNITVVPNAGTVGTRVVVSGQCYYLHSGRGGEIYFDDTRLGAVGGDTGGDYEAGFVVPMDAVPGPHVVRLVTFLATNQSTTFEVEAPESLPTSTTTSSPTPTLGPPQPTPSASETTAPGTMALTTMGNGGACAVAPIRRATGVDSIFLCVPAVLLARREIGRTRPSSSD